MTRQMINDGQAYERANRRDAKVRKLTRWSVFMLVVLCLTAIGQERALAPPVHDGMARVGDMAMTYIGQSETLSSALTDFQDGYDKLLAGG